MKYPADDELQPGVVLQQRYEIVKKIGAGGFGEVYLAKRLKFRQRVAVKKLRATMATEAIRKQFEKEAALLFGLTHHGLPKVVDAFSQDDGEFLVMEYVEGKDLDELRRERKGPLDLPQVLLWADQVLEALEYLHSQRPPVIHRDIKPHNIKLRPDGSVVLLDFGLAKGASGLMWSTTVPEAGSIAAHSFGFSPLEQMAKNPTDERSDLYSLAATLYTLLANSVPEVSVVRGSEVAHRRPDPLVPIRALNPAVPEAVESVILKSLAIHREDRHASASQFRLALGLAAKLALERDDHPKTVPWPLEPTAEVTAGRGPAVGSIVAALTLLGLLAVVGIGWWAFQPTKSAVVSDETIVMKEPPEPEVAVVAPQVEVLRYRLERMDGAPLELVDGRIPKKTEFRLKLWTPAEGRVFLVLKNSDGRSMVYVSDKPSVSTTGIESNSVRAGEEFVFPGRGRPFSVEKGTERLLVGFAREGVKVPAGLEGNPLEWLSAGDAGALDQARAEISSEVQLNGEDGRMLVLVNEEALGGLVMFDVNELSERVGGPK